MGDVNSGGCSLLAWACRENWLRSWFSAEGGWPKRSFVSITMGVAMDAEFGSGVSVSGSVTTEDAPFGAGPVEATPGGRWTRGDSSA